MAALEAASAGSGSGMRGGGGGERMVVSSARACLFFMFCSVRCASVFVIKGSWFYLQ